MNRTGPLLSGPLLSLALFLVPAATLAQAPPAPADDGAPRIEVAECQKLLTAGKAVIIDTRGADAYRVSHIPGALSSPVDDVQAKATELKKTGKTVIAYCG